RRRGGSMERGTRLALVGVLFWYPPARAVQGRAEIEARASIQGDQAARALAEVALGAISFRAGAESAAGERAPLRHPALAGGTLRRGAWGGSLAARLLPSRGGAPASAAGLGVRRDFGSAAAALALMGQRSSWAGERLAALGGAAEIEARLPLSLRGSVRAAA